MRFPSILSSLVMMMLIAICQPVQAEEQADNDLATTPTPDWIFGKLDSLIVGDWIIFNLSVTLKNNNAIDHQMIIKINERLGNKLTLGISDSKFPQGREQTLVYTNKSTLVQLFSQWLPQEFLSDMKNNKPMTVTQMGSEKFNEFDCVKYQAQAIYDNAHHDLTLNGIIWLSEDAPVLGIARVEISDAKKEANIIAKLADHGDKNKPLPTLATDD